MPDIEFTPEEIAIGEAFVRSVEDGSLRAEVDAKVDPEWNAKYGDASWEAALFVFGYGPLPGTPGGSLQTPAPDEPRDEGGR